MHDKIIRRSLRNDIKFNEHISELNGWKMVVLG